MMLKKIFKFQLILFLFFSINNSFLYSSEAALVEDVSKGIVEDLGSDAARISDEAAENMQKNVEKIVQNSIKGLSKEALSSPALRKALSRSLSKNITKSLGGGETALNNLARDFTKTEKDSFENLFNRVTYEARGATISTIEDGIESGAIKVADKYASLQSLKALKAGTRDLNKIFERDGKINAFKGMKFGDEGVDNVSELGDGESIDAQQKRLRFAFGDEYDQEDNLINDKGEKVKDAQGEFVKREAGLARKIGRGTWKGIKGTFEFLGSQAAMIGFMTGGQLIQQYIEAEAARKAALRTIAGPKMFGDKVIQMVNSCVDTEYPEKSFPLYVTIPVESIGDPISSETYKAFNRSVSNESSKIFSGVSAYGMTPEYYKYARFVMSYPEQSYNQIGMVPITDPQFSDLVVFLNQGAVMNGTGGLTKNPKQPPLIDAKAHAAETSMNTPVESIAHALPKLYSKLSLAGEIITQQGISSSAKGVTPSEILKTYFDCNAQTGKTVSDVKGAKCLLRSALGRYASIMNYGSMGKVSPIFGWGTTISDDIINFQNFPYNVPISIDEAGVLVTGLGNINGKPVKKAKKSVEHYAPADNYSALGCWVCLATDTPFAKAVQGNSSSKSATGPYVDYVIFLKHTTEGFEPVAPYKVDFVPVPGTPVVTLPQVIPNPDAEYMASLISTDMADFMATLDGKQVPVVYTKTGEKVYFNNSKAVINGALSTFESGFPELASQFKAHQQALLSRYDMGPFEMGNEEFLKSNYIIKEGSASVLTMYEGMPCFGTSGEGRVDGLFFVNSGGNLGTMRSRKINAIIDIVTDVSYDVQPDGSLSLSGSDAFKNAPGKWNGKKFVPFRSGDSRSQQFYWFNYLKSNLTEALKNNGGKITGFDDMEAYIKKQRSDWLVRYDNSDIIHGVTVSGVTFKLASELDRAKAEKSKCYIYDISPNPSITTVGKSWFIVTPQDAPSLRGLTMLNMASSDESKAKSIVNIITGEIFDMSGKQKMNGDQPAMLITGSFAEHGSIGQMIYNRLERNFKKGLNQKFLTDYAAKLDTYKKMADRVDTVGIFGDIPLGAYPADQMMNVNVYFVTEGLAASEKFEPTDLVTTFNVNPSTKKYDFGRQPFGENTKFIVSLVSGQLWDENGPKLVIPMSDIMKYTQIASRKWRPLLKNKLNSLQADYIAEQEAMKKEMEDAEARNKAKQDQKLLWSKANVKQVIARLQNEQFLPTPFESLKQDPMTEIFVLLAPGSLKNDDVYIYTFFNVPNSYKTADGKSVQVGAAYTEDGDMIYEIHGDILTAVMHQHGLYGKAEKTIAMPLLQPSLLMDKADENLTPGKSGKTMLCGISKDFPGEQIVLPKGYFLYYDTVVNNYYVCNAALRQLIDPISGHIFDMKGAPLPEENPVAINNLGTESDILMLEKNNGGYWQGILRDPYRGNLFDLWKNNGQGTWKSSEGQATVAVTTNKERLPQSCKVTFEDVGGTRKEQKLYSLKSSYTWQDLFLVPVNAKRQLLVGSKAPGKQFESARRVMENGVMKYLIFAGHIFKVTAQPSEFEFSLSSADPGSRATINVKELIDPNTKSPYIRISAGFGAEADVYRYVYQRKRLNDSQLTTFNEIVAMGISATCPTSVPFGPFVKRQSDAGDEIEVPSGRTYLQFSKNLPQLNSLMQIQPNQVKNLPSQKFSTYDVAMGMISSRIVATPKIDGRFLCKLFKKDGQEAHKPFIPYFNSNGYVDLSNGMLFDSSGNAAGITLSIEDFLAVLNTVMVQVVIDKEGNRSLSYRTPSEVKSQSDKLNKNNKGASSYTPYSIGTTSVTNKNSDYDHFGPVKRVQGA